MIRFLILAAAAFGLAFAAGCKHKCGHCGDPCRQAKPSIPGGTTNPYLLPPAGLPTTPGPGAGIPPVGPSDLRNYPPLRPEPEVLLPDPIPGNGSSRNALPGILGGPVKPTTEPPLTQKGSDSPTGLPSYLRAKDGIASGRKPTADGIGALKQAGFRTVIYLHPTGADLASMKELASRRGLAFVAIETTPEKLASAVEQFNATVADAARHPAYVFDDDGVRTGAIWYLHFRTADSMNDDAARVRARPLGLTDDGIEAKAFALATQRYLEMR